MSRKDFSPTMKDSGPLNISFMCLYLFKMNNDSYLNILFFPLLFPYTISLRSLSINSPLYGYTTFCSPKMFSWWTFGLFPLWGYCVLACYFIVNTHILSSVMLHLKSSISFLCYISTKKWIFFNITLRWTSSSLYMYVFRSLYVHI